MIAGAQEKIKMENTFPENTDRGLTLLQANFAACVAKYPLHPMLYLLSVSKTLTSANGLSNFLGETPKKREATKGEELCIFLPEILQGKPLQSSN